ncbi:MAG: glycosyltransferase family 39 protein, partial [Thermoleophilia bacterium]
MSTLTSPAARGPRRHPRPRSRAGSRLRAGPHPELGALLITAATLGLWGLSRNSMASLYYSAAVRSMTESWSNFFFGSFDASGVMTVDKPPLALWVQAASVKVFGFNSWAILVPEALMSVASVGLTYDLVRRPFGRVAATVAGLALAITPISVAMARHNNPEALLTLCSVAAVWFAVRGLRDHRMRWMVLSGVSIGLGFEAKMAAALMVVPGIAAAYLWVAPRGLRATVTSLAAWAGSMVAVGLAWPVAVWLTPAGSRPWVSGTSDNSIWSLILGYNGLGRLFGQSGGPAGGGMGGGGTFGGSPGLTRMWNQAIGGQIGWLLGGSLVAVAGVAVLTRLRRRDVRTGWLLAVGGSLVVTFIAFSKASGIFHPYYVALLAPFVAALFGAGVGVALRANAGQHDRLVGVLTIGGGIAGEMAVMGGSATDLTGWRVPV